MTDDQVEAERQRMCVGKQRYGAKTSRDVAEKLQAERIDVHPYRCIFCGRWHVGHTPDMRTVERIAELIRHRTYPTITKAAG